MFFVTHLRRELGRRMRQAVFIALGLALGVGLVVTVAATSAGFSSSRAATGWTAWTSGISRSAR